MPIDKPVRWFHECEPFKQWLVEKGFQWPKLDMNAQRGLIILWERETLEKFKRMQEEEYARKKGEVPCP